MSRSALRIVGVTLVVIVGFAIAALAIGFGRDERREGPPLVVAEEDEIGEDIVTVGRSIEVVGRVRGGVLALGGDVYVSGRVEGDVAAVGGSVKQSEGSLVSGDVLVVGGVYDKPGGTEFRVAGTNTLILGGDSESLRRFFANPTRELLAPSITRAFVGWRLAAALFSFLISLGIAAVAPSAVSGASERVLTHGLRVAVIGLLGTVVLLLGAGVVLRLLSTPLAALVLLPLFAIVLVAQIFGRVVAYFLVGRWLQRRLLGDRSRSQTVALLIGVMVVALVGSMPVVGALVIFGTFILSTGIVLTGSFRAPQRAWQ